MKLTLILTLLISTLICIFSYSQIKSGISQVLKSNKVTHIKVGETYKFDWVKPGEKRESIPFELIRLIDEQNFIKLSDNAHLSKEYYEEDQDNKVIALITGTYTKEGDNFIQTSYQSYQILSFDSDIEVKKGSKGEIGDFMSKEEKEFEPNKGGGDALQKYKGSYRINSSNLKGRPSTNFEISDVKLPDTAEEVISQYNLTTDQ
ncbi:hypothetical protein RU86_GL001640 [Lactococcus piscium]|uniref:Uncharacterized protein n=2 Tax=Pseudolactococcus piscium TaxID=1364 RepID=A0A2A5RUJ1_9LACT|nr:hypothetical protein RU86_GL001640 [Lactococcus piscium]